MEASVWNRTLDDFRRKIDSGEPVPAGVSVSAVTASFALALVAKVLDIVARRKNFAGDRQRLDALRDAARAESTRFTHLADEDIQAFNEYLECVRGGDEQAIAAAARKTIEVPMNGARAAVRGLELCEEAAAMVRGLIASDIGIAEALLSGCVRAISISVDSNLKGSRPGDPFSEAIRAESRELQREAARREDHLGTARGV